MSGNYVADQCLFFYTVQSLQFLNPKFQASSDHVIVWPGLCSSEDTGFVVKGHTFAVMIQSFQTGPLANNADSDCPTTAV